MLNSYDIYEKLNGSSNSCKYCLNWAEDDCKMKQVLFVQSGAQEKQMFVCLFVCNDNKNNVSLYYLSDMDL